MTGVAVALIDAAESRRALRACARSAEPTSGNTVTGRPSSARLNGYLVIGFMPDKMSKDKIDLLRRVRSEGVVPDRVPPTP